MPAYYIGEHKISNFALFDDYLAKVMPMVEPLRRPLSHKAGFTRNTGGGLETQSGGYHRISRYCVDQKLVPGTGIPTAHRIASKRRDRRDDHARRIVSLGLKGRVRRAEFGGNRAGLLGKEAPFSARHCAELACLRLERQTRSKPGSTREFCFTARSSLMPNALRGPQPRPFPAFPASARSPRA